MGRIERICSYLDASDSFADVGCDHGFCTEYMLKSGLCQTAYISDISAKSLSKAERLLGGYIKSGVCKSVVCDGLKGIPKTCSQVLVAGMGGMEIIKILREGFIPQKFVFQPMKNAPELRRFLLESGCKIIADTLFKDDKFYFIIKGEGQGKTLDYSEKEIMFGRDSLNTSVFKEYAEEELAKKLGYIKNCDKGSDISKISKEILLLEEVLENDS